MANLSYRTSPRSGEAPTSSRQLTLYVLLQQPRRKLLVALSDGKARTAAELRHEGKGDGWCKDPENYLNSTLKNLKVMLEAGLVVQEDDSRDGRWFAYRLAPAIKVTRQGDLTVFHLPHCVIRLGPDGN